MTKKKSSFGPRVRAGSQSPKHRKSNAAVPPELACLLYLPDNVGSVKGYEWSPVCADPPWREEIRGALTQFAAPTVEEQIQVEVERALKLPPDEFRAWMTEAQKRHDAALTNPMCWGGAV
jgi:hypothetical protein